MSYQGAILQVLSGLSVEMVIFIIAAGLSIVRDPLSILLENAVSQGETTAG